MAKKKTVNPLAQGGRPVVALLTDFGLSDNYVGVMKGVIISGIPSVQLVDLTHQIPAQNIRMGAFQILTSYKNFNPGTFFICVVDPGVGTSRKIIYAKTDHFQFIAPDNGILSWVFQEEKPMQVFSLDPQKVGKQKISATFHGRDVMAPAAVRILSGERLANMGKPLQNWAQLPFPKVEKTGSLWKGQILAIDGFGNLITNVRTQELSAIQFHSKLWIEWGEKSGSIRGLSESYSDGKIGRLLAVGGSAGFVEIAVRDGNAAKLTGLKTDSPVHFHFRT